MTPFLPEGYRVPKTSDNYLKLADGESAVVRILDMPITGWVGWKKEPRVPVRRAVPEFSPGEVVEDDKNSIRHFWAMPVWNHEKARVQVWEVTQSTIQTQIKGLYENKRWGDPREYDLEVKRDKVGGKVSYVVTALPKEPLPEAAQQAWATTKLTFDINALFTNGDPFRQAPSDSSWESAPADKDIPF